jgi:hypothetical protein
MWLPLKRNRCIAIAAWLGAGIVLATTAELHFASARGGYVLKPPRPFTREELILVEKCRFLARSRGMDSPLFARECATVIPYLNEPPCICSEQIDHVPKNELPKR